MSHMTAQMASIQNVDVQAFTIPTKIPEANGTLEWQSTTLIVVRVEASGKQGIGYTYTHPAAASLITEKFRDLIIDSDALDIESRYQALIRCARNLGRPGLASCALSAVDIALWDLKAKIFNVPLVTLLGEVRGSIPVYASGGLTSYSPRQLSEQMEQWVRQGFRLFKIKIGNDVGQEMKRLKLVREIIGQNAELFVDANGSCTRRSALRMAQMLENYQVSWFEEPVTSDDLDGLLFIRGRLPAGIDVAAGEYGYEETYFRRMLERQSVDVLQADATRCGGISGFLKIGHLCECFCLPLSTHTAPMIHLHLSCALKPVCHLEYLYDHARIESMLFDGVVTPQNGRMVPDKSRSGLGLEFKESDAKPYQVYG